MADYQLIVIGAGPGGYEAALRAAKLGKRVAVVERREAGGTCLNRGCIPTKTLLHASAIYRDAKNGAHCGIHTEDIHADMAEIFAYKRAVSQKLSAGIESLFKSAKIDLLRGTHDRVTEMDFTIPAVRGYAEKIKASGFDGVLINITNPCDIVTRELALHLGLPRGRVFGTGTGLDTSRLLSALARQTGLDHKSITCYMMGEHGNQQFAPWSCVSFRGVPLDEWAKTDERFRFDRDALQKESIGGGWVTFSGKFCTEYGIATTAARMAYAVLHDEKVILPASTELCGEYGEEGLFAGVPCVIGENGVEQVVELPLTADEKATFHACCEGIRHNMEHLKEI